MKETHIIGLMLALLWGELLVGKIAIAFGFPVENVRFAALVVFTVVAFPMMLHLRDKNK